jgi:SAM-dependent methyltransferase
MAVPNPFVRCPPFSRVHRRKISSVSAINRPQAAEVQPTKSIYSLPALYDLAFGYRDFYEEVQFLLSKHASLVGTSAQRILEVAAGPSRHSITALLLQLDESGPPVSAYCVDASPEMAAYAQHIVREELADLPSPPDAASFLSSNYQYQVADMRNFSLEATVGSDSTTPVQVDTIWVLLGSLQHMLTNQDVIDCFTSMHRALVSNGTVFIELPHPREATFNMIECTRNGWKVPLEGKENNMRAMDDEDGNDDAIDEGELSIVWGDDGDEFDPITQIRKFTIRFDLLGRNEEHSSVDGKFDKALEGSKTATSDIKSIQSIHQVVPMRLFTAQEIDALARCVGFEVVAMFGALEEGVDVNDEDASYRLVSVLRKHQRS